MSNIESKYNCEEMEFDEEEEHYIPEHEIVKKPTRVMSNEELIKVKKVTPTNQERVKKFYQD